MNLIGDRRRSHQSTCDVNNDRLQLTARQAEVNSKELMNE